MLKGNCAQGGPWHDCVMALVNNQKNLDPNDTVLRRHPITLPSEDVAKYEASYLRSFYKVYCFH